MKIIAFTEMSGAYNRSPRKILLEVSTDELAKLLGQDRFYRDEEEKLKIGQTLNLEKVWNDVHSLRRFYNESSHVTSKLRKYCDDIDSLEIPNIFEEKP